MKIVWDDPKRMANLNAHELDVADFETCFDFGSVLARRTRPSLTGHERFVLISGWSDGRVVSAIVSPLGSEALSLISLRTASEKEREVYDGA